MRPRFLFFGQSAVRRSAALLLAALILTSALIPTVLFPLSVSAADEDETVGSIKASSYDITSKKLTVEGTLPRALLSVGDSHTLALYLLPPGVPEEDLIADPDRSPLATANASLSFRLTADVPYADAIGCRFLITDRTEDGETVVASPFRIDVKLAGKRPGGTKGSFKGIVSDAYRPEDSAEMTVIPVLLDTLLTESTGGIGYTVGDTFHLFDKVTVESLDAKIRLARTTGTRVYLRLLCEGMPGSLLSPLAATGGEIASGYEYVLPDLSSAENRLLYAGAVSFLCERYGAETGMDISGLVFGSRLDLSTATANGEMTETALCEYLAAAYALTLSAMAEVRDDLFLTLSFSDSNPYGTGTAHLRGRYNPLTLLSAVCETVDREFLRPTTVTLMIESGEMPVVEVNSAGTETVSYALRSSSNYLSVVRLQTLETALLRLAKSYASAPKTYSFLLSNGDGLTGDALGAAVVYAYYVGYSSRMMESLCYVLSPDDYRNVRSLLRDVDSDRSEEATAPLCRLLGVDSWDDLLEVPDLSAKEHVRLSGATLTEIPDTVLGHYPYFDYAYHTGVGTWFGAGGCTAVRIESDTERGRTLTANLSLSGTSGQYADLVCAFEYPENFVYTPYLGITLTLDEADDAEDLYEVRVRLGKDRNDVAASFLVRGEKTQSIILDMSPYTDGERLCSYLSLSIRPLSGSDREVTAHLHSVIGYSEEYRTEELESAIAESRWKIRSAESSGNGPTLREIAVIVAIVVGVSAVVGLGVFLILRQDEKKRKDESEPE